MNSQKTDNYSPSQQDCSIYAVSELYSSLDYCSSSTSSSSSTPSSPSDCSTLHTPEPELIQPSLKTSIAKVIGDTDTTVVAVASPVPPKKQYQCPDCLKFFSRPSALQTHSYTHTSEKPFQCTKPGCGRKFSVVSNLRRHFKVHQKPAVSNKLSSEDRLRYVRQLIRTSEIILARQKEAEEEAQRSLAGRSYHNENQQQPQGPCSVIHLPQPVSSNYQYQHYFVVPTIDNITCNNLTSMESNTRTHATTSVRAPLTTAATTMATTRHETNYLASSVIGVPCSWDQVEPNPGAYNLHPLLHHPIQPQQQQQHSRFDPGFINSASNPNHVKQNNHNSSYFYS